MRPYQIKDKGSLKKVKWVLVTRNFYVTILKEPELHISQRGEIYPNA